MVVKILSLNDTFAGFCSDKKKNWYLNNGLATIVNDNSIKLIFVHKMKYNEKKMYGYSIDKSKSQNNTESHINQTLDCFSNNFDQNDSIRTTKQNPNHKCVVCGINDNLIKHKIIPYDFRKWLPTHMKSHTNFDVILLCTICLSNTHHYENNFRKQLYEKYNFIFDRELYNLIRYSKWLLDKDNKIHKNLILKQKRLQEISVYLAKNISTINDEDLIKLSNLLPYKNIDKNISMFHDL